MGGADRFVVQQILQRAPRVQEERSIRIMTALPPIKVLIVDDHPLYRIGIKNFLKQLWNTVHFVEVDNGCDAILKLKEEKYDLVYVDMDMPVMDGFELAYIIRRYFRRTRVIMMTEQINITELNILLSLGVRGYLQKNMDGEQLKLCTSRVIKGKVYLGVDTYSGSYDRLEPKLISRKLGPKPKLTLREVEILRLICKGLGTKQIAEHLIIAHCTVMNHKAKIARKIGIGSRVGMVIYALREGYFRVGTRHQAAAIVQRLSGL